MKEAMKTVGIPLLAIVAFWFTMWLGVHHEEQSQVKCTDREVSVIEHAGEVPLPKCK